MGHCLCKFCDVSTFCSGKVKFKVCPSEVEEKVILEGPYRAVIESLSRGVRGPPPPHVWASDITSF